MTPTKITTYLLALLVMGCAEPNKETTGKNEPPGNTVGQTVMLKAHNGTYVGCELGGDTVLQDALRAGKDTVADWEYFTQFTNADGTVAFQAANGKYWCADSDKGNLILANRGYIGAWESFEIVPQSGGEVAIRSHTGKYIAADHGLPEAQRGRLVADRLSVGDWELFTIIPVTSGTP